MPEFFLELFSEEIPARMQRDAAQALQDRCLQAFHFLKPTSIKTFYGPRRLAYSATIDADDSKGKTDTAEARGPRVGAPDQAIDGFLKKFDGDRSQLLIENGYYVLRQTLAANSAKQIIETDLAKSLSRLPWQKSMRWGQGGDFTWVRPLRRVVCLLDGEVIPIKIGPITASNESEGHRFLASGSFAVSSSRDWEAKLRDHFVIPDYKERRRQFTNQLLELARERKLTVVHDEPLFDEVSGLVEWPVVLVGRIDDEFMDLPPEVRELSMKVNQRYFALRDIEGNPAPYFAFVSNIDAKDHGKQIVAGNERVLRARLSDARHFWDLDLRTPLHELLPKLDKITFHAKIGSQHERAKRISWLAAKIANALSADGYESTQAQWAGLLCKADLVTGMVGEFPELQGIMGGYYAERNYHGWDGSIVGPAIKTHYQPKGPGDAVPTATVAMSVALADKLDTLTQFFAVGEKPTGSGDPYALRRAALGVIRIILENELTLNLNELIESRKDVFDFVIERLRVKLRSEGQRFDILDAVLGNRPDDDLYRIMQLVDAVRDFLASDDGGNLLVAYRRASNILKIEDAKDGPHRGDAFRTDLDQQREERELGFAIGALRQEFFGYGDVPAGGMLEFRKFKFILENFARLRVPVDEFFDKVTVNAAEPAIRRNRLSLLALLRDTMHQIADFSKIEG